MIDAKFTPGPWTAEKQSVKTATGLWLATCTDIEAERGKVERDKNEDYANATLIAAAPDLYAALLALSDGLIAIDDILGQAVVDAHTKQMIAFIRDGASKIAVDALTKATDTKGGSRE